jgi:hypothetical protein
MATKKWSKAQRAKFAATMHKRNGSVQAAATEAGATKKRKQVFVFEPDLPGAAAAVEATAPPLSKPAIFYSLSEEEFFMFVGGRKFPVRIIP